MSVVDVYVPQLGMAMESATVSQWLKEVGERVVEGEELVEIEIEKVMDSIVSPASGVLIEKLGVVGTVYRPGDIIARVEI